MKVAIILGRGTEGCGVTQCAIQMQKAIGADIYSANDKKWPRAKGFDFPVTELNLGKSWERLAAEVNKYDLCVVYSIPSITHPKDCQDNFIHALKAITIRKAFINVDHKAASIARNANLKEVCESVDIIMTHSLQNAFCDTIIKLDVKTPVVKMGLGFDYDNHRAQYWKPIEDQQSNLVRWIGRTATWKGPAPMIDFHEARLMNSGFITILEGLEASINYPSVLYRDKEQTNRRKVVNFFRPEKQHGETTKFTRDMYGKEVTGVGAYLYPPYTNQEGMERMSHSAFGSDLYYLDAKMYGNNIENCHAEIVACGSVPIFHKHFCDNVIHKVQGAPISKCVNSGTLALDHTNFDMVADTMIKLKNDSVMRNEWREMAFEFWKQHSDGKEVIAEIINLAFNNETQLQAQSKLKGFF
jgi:hypothetical protein